MSTDLICLYTTTDSEASAQAMAHAVVERGLAACVQISSIQSVYRWNGAVQSAAEFRLLVKTTRAQRPAAQALLLQLHPYELPAIWSVQIDEASPAYTEWVRGNSQGA